MNVEEKRKLLFSFLLEHTAEAAPLRERVLDRLILVSLSDTDGSSSLQISEVQDRIKFGTVSEDVLRHDIIRSRLLALTELEYVVKIKHKKFSTYYISDKGKRELDAVSRSVSELFNPILDDILHKIDTDINQDIAADAFRIFVSECFSRYGQSIARSVTGDITYAELSKGKNFSDIFYSAIQSFSLPAIQVESLKSQCISFLKSEEPIYTQLKFKLTQSYYMAQLLGLDSPQFNPIAEDAFNNATFYLDTNILILYFLPDWRYNIFHELTHFAARNNIHLKVTEATIEELHRVITSKIKDIESILKIVPEPLAEKTRDEFLIAFLEKRKTTTDLSPSDFAEELNNIEEILVEYEIELEPQTPVLSLIASENIVYICDTIDTVAQRVRGYGKPEDVQKHDAAHYLLISELKAESPKVWFLTRDRTLSFVATILDENSLPFCFQIFDLLQCISPFIQRTNGKIGLADLFSNMMLEDISGIPKTSMLDIPELKLLGQLHSDVLTTPAEDLIGALDFVKRTFLEGKPYHSDRDHTIVALELKKYLNATSTEREERLQQSFMEERAMTVEAFQKNKQLDDKIEELRNKLKESEKKGKSLKSLNRWIGIISLTIGIIGSILILGYSTEISNIIIQSKTVTNINVNEIKNVLQLSAAIILIVSLLPVIVIVKNKYVDIVAVIITSVITLIFGFRLPTPVVNAFSTFSLIFPVILILFFLIRVIRKQD